jgi:hypothetical protein
LLFWIIFLGGWGQLGLSFTSIAHETSHTIIPPEAVTPIDHPTNPPIVSAFLVPHALYQIVISACSQGSFWLLNFLGTCSTFWFFRSFFLSPHG